MGGDRCRSGALWRPACVGWRVSESGSGRRRHPAAGTGRHPDGRRGGCLAQDHASPGAAGGHPVRAPWATDPPLPRAGRTGLAGDSASGANRSALAPATPGGHAARGRPVPGRCRSDVIACYHNRPEDAVLRRIPRVALLVRIPAPLHQRAKLAAVRRRMSVARLVTEALTAHLRYRPTPGGKR